MRTEDNCDPTAGDGDGGWPPWIGRLTQSVMGVLAVVTLVTLEEPVTPLMVALVAVSVSYWIAEAAGFKLPFLLSCASLYGAMVAIHWFGPQLGLYDVEFHAQFSLMLMITGTGEIAATRPLRQVLLAVGAGLVIIGVRSVRMPLFDGPEIWGTGLLLVSGGAYALGELIRRTDELERAQSALAEEVAASERARIAREVHDVVAHSLSVTMLHVTAARLAVRRSPAEAEASLEEAERVGRQSLADIRRTVGLLRRDPSDGAHASPTAPPLPGFADLPELVAGYRAAGLDVDANVELEPERVSSGVQLAAYRVVQEALANVARHAAGARATVHIHNGDNRVVVRVGDDGRGAVGEPVDVSGNGLRGMRERVEQQGGELRAGPEGRGWAVEAVFPA